MVLIDALSATRGAHRWPRDRARLARDLRSGGAGRRAEGPPTLGSACHLRLSALSREPNMRLTDLPRDVLEQIRRYRYDRIIEKHEGPERWEAVLESGETEFLTLAGRDVLLPVPRESHPNITLLRAIVSEDGTVLTLFLRDTSYGQE